MSAILAKALNSTIGTDNFKSFDEILMKSKSIIPDSDAVYFPLDVSVQDMYPNINETTVLAFKLPIYGGVNLIYSIGLSATASVGGADYAVYIKIYKNGIQIGSAFSRVQFSSEDKSSFEIFANPDDVITITISSVHTTRYNLYMRLHSLNGKVIDAVPINIISKYGG